MEAFYDPVMRFPDFRKGSARRPMLRLLRSASGIWLVWLVLLVALVFMRPHPSTALFWVLAIAVVGVGIVQMARSRSEDARERAAYAEWSHRLSELGARIDLEDDGHLFEWLDPPQWQQVFARLEAMPAGSRSLRKAIQSTYPEVYHEGA
jgi:hypothetical protein